MCDQTTARIVRDGYCEAVYSHENELWVHTDTDGLVRFVVKDKRLRDELNCTRVRATIEILESSGARGLKR